VKLDRSNVNASTIVQTLWNYCNVLRDDMSYCYYVEQLTYLLFLKMTDRGSQLLDDKLVSFCSALRNARA